MQLQIYCKNNSTNELKVKEMLLMFNKNEHIVKWIFTRNILVDELASISYSHPVLTMNTRHVKNEGVLLSTYVHEQIHWYAVQNFDQLISVIDELKENYQQVPVGYPLGAKDEFSTYLHLIINFLEIRAIKQLLGRDKATDVIEYLIQDHYIWIYKTVIQDYHSLEKLLNHHNLLI
ncbi:hypothetical protein ACFSCX_07125 [Bacillus salitolerans]|uniref:Uncharacterized protein n=1 Tax=Bacillus salitolerans TaxID=1437434 RepID=A0ABW4LMC1_9BACI